MEAGLSPAAALSAATWNAARFFGRERDLGTVETGKLADLVILDANPLADIRNVRSVHAVILNGRFLDRKSLDEAMKKLP